MIKELVFTTIYNEAVKKGREAGYNHNPAPMVVTQHANPLNDNSPPVKQWLVNSGVCGFAWVVVSPGTSSFAKWLVRMGHAEKHYYGGVSIWIREYNQSMECKDAHARAMANYFSLVGIKAYSQSRMD